MTEQQPQRQSRVGKRPLPLPQGVKATVKGDHIFVEGPKGKLDRVMPAHVRVDLTDSNLSVLIKSDAGRVGPQYQGLARALLLNMVEGVSKGYHKSLDLRGVGYRAELKGQDLTLALGFSHQIKFSLPELVKARVEIIDEGGIKFPRLHLESINKELLGQWAARVRTTRPAEPYKGKGVRYTGEKIREKAGKSGAKK